MTANQYTVRSTIFSSVCFAALLSAALPAKALVLTYGGEANWDNSATTGNVNQVRPLQLPRTGAAVPNARNFIFDRLDAPDVPGHSRGNPVWTPVGQFGSTNPYEPPSTSVPLGPYSQRFDYSLSAADQSTDSPYGTIYTWNNSVNLLRFGDFYLAGDCLFCGADKVVSITNLPAIGGTASYVPLESCQSEGVFFNFFENTFVSPVFNIRFGSSGITGTMKFSAEYRRQIGEGICGTSSSAGGGEIILEIPDDQLAPTRVPEPTALSLLLAAFGGLWLLRRGAIASIRADRIDTRVSENPSLRRGTGDLAALRTLR